MDLREKGWEGVVWMLRIRNSNEPSGSIKSWIFD
jgi:hypothetical protein